MDRRHVLSASLAAGATVAGIAAADQSSSAKPKTILGIACSPREGKTTAASIAVALEAVKETHASLNTELIDLGGLTFKGWNGTGKFSDDDFSTVLLPKLKDPNVKGLIIGSPVYFRNMSSLCMALLERMGALRKPELLLANKIAGALSVGGYRHGGQELVVQQIQAAMLCHEVLLVGGKPGAHQGAMLWNEHKDDISKDTFGIETAKQLGIRVAEAVYDLV
ncbi:MAG: flavodoxin family protein [Kiritimatiellales bacterium]|nr:flavodoxin family protein [Kiritimatiellales bacterium]